MQNKSDNTGFNAEEAADTINIRQELEKYLFHWKWFFSMYDTFISWSIFLFKIRNTFIQCGNYDHD